MIKHVAIAGLGWLGQPLAYRLATLGYAVKASVTSVEKATLLQQNGFEVYPLAISETGVTGEIHALLNEVHCLIILIPPGLRKNTGADHVLKMAHFIEKIKAAGVKKVILVSSTSVYADSQNEVTEKDVPAPDTLAGKQLQAVEMLFRKAEKLQTTIVRFGGLIGGSRQPVKYLAGRRDLVDGNAPVNLIHRDDCIAILVEIIKQDAFGHLFNAVNPHHPKKAAYYIEKARALGLEPPTFAMGNPDEVYKQVDSENLATILNYAFRVSI